MYIAKIFLTGIVLLMLAMNTVDAVQGNPYSNPNLANLKPSGHEPGYSPPYYDLTGEWHVQISNWDVLIIKQSGNTIEGTIYDFNSSQPLVDPIAGTIYGNQVEFTRTHLNEWTRQHSGVVYIIPGDKNFSSHLSMQGTLTTTGDPGQYSWTAYGPPFKTEGLPDNLHRVDEPGSRGGPVP